MWMPARSLPNTSCLAYEGLATSFRILSFSCLSLVFSQLLLIFTLTISQVYHSFAEHQVVHQLVEFFFELALHLFPELCVHPDIALHPWLLVKLKGSVDFFQSHTLFQIKLQVPVMGYVRWVETILFHAVSSEVFKHVCQQDHICLEIEVVANCQGCDIQTFSTRFAGVRTLCL